MNGSEHKSFVWCAYQNHVTAVSMLQLFLLMLRLRLLYHRHKPWDLLSRGTCIRSKTIVEISLQTSLRFCSISYRCEMWCWCSGWLADSLNDILGIRVMLYLECVYFNIIFFMKNEIILFTLFTCYLLLVLFNQLWYHVFMFNIILCSKYSWIYNYLYLFTQ